MSELYLSSLFRICICFWPITLLLDSIFLLILAFWPLMMRLSWGGWSCRFGFLAVISLIIRPTDRPPLLSVLPALFIWEPGEGSGEGDGPLLFDLLETNWMFFKGIFVLADPFDPAESSEPDLFLPLRMTSSLGLEPPNRLLSASWFWLLFCEPCSYCSDREDALAAPIRKVGDLRWATELSSSIVDPAVCKCCDCEFSKCLSEKGAVVRSVVGWVLFDGLCL
jgi:hypothetical protein